MANDVLVVELLQHFKDTYDCDNDMDMENVTFCSMTLGVIKWQVTLMWQFLKNCWTQILTQSWLTECDPGEPLQSLAMQKNYFLPRWTCSLYFQTLSSFHLTILNCNSVCQSGTLIDRYPDFDDSQDSSLKWQVWSMMQSSNAGIHRCITTTLCGENPMGKWD